MKFKQVSDSNSETLLCTFDCYLLRAHHAFYFIGADSQQKTMIHQISEKLRERGECISVPVFDFFFIDVIIIIIIDQSFAM